jgi:hypothetical protein
MHMALSKSPNTMDTFPFMCSYHSTIYYFILFVRYSLLLVTKWHKKTHILSRNYQIMSSLRQQIAPNSQT